MGYKRLGGLSLQKKSLWASAKGPIVACVT